MLTLRNAGQSLVVSRAGAAIVGWTRGPTQILRRARPEAVAGDVHMKGCFPLVPYCNRIAGGKFAWGGLDYQINLNFGDHPNAIHGIGWQLPWTVEELDSALVTLRLCHVAEGARAQAWPFSFDAEVTYRLTETGLVISLHATNRHTGPAPMGLGLHPYVIAAGTPTLAFASEAVWLNEASLPSSQVVVPAEWSHAAGRRVGTARLDNCFTGWNGYAVIDNGRASLTIEADPLFAALQVFTPEGADFFCVEPVSHLPDAINRLCLPNDQRMAVLEPGQTIGGSITFSLPAMLL